MIFFRRFLNIDYLNRNPLPYLSTITHTQSQRWSNTILVRKRHAYNPNHSHITHKNILLNVYRHHPTVIQYTTLLIIIGIFFFRYTSVIYVVSIVVYIIKADALVPFVETRQKCKDNSL